MASTAPLICDNLEEDPKRIPYKQLQFLDSPQLADLGALVMRVIVSSLILHHGLDKLQHSDAFTANIVEKHFAFLPGPAVMWTFISAYVEVVGCTCLLLGVFARVAALVLAPTMLFALSFHLRVFGAQNFPFDPATGGAYTFEPCLAFFGVMVYFALAGPGRFALRPHGF
eukprot:gnl/TRDRNA2_/TRDRNA2_178897_c0_seq1.p2 gnl/TRDRNA2_/TRDRNA2_178897_c0~~gnl/TRDRNA2_/TRDRNA2_178897_c0_seq1.p2  ORF type:complete len:170 (+),score=24.30 gnl/TRDRNA2_/TRDRNA2_178897_c0_seq1:73-582(+)